MARAIDSIISAWQAGKSRRDGNVSTDGKWLWSYNAAIALEVDNKFYILENGCYSVTTSKHCNQVEASCPANCVERVTRERMRELVAIHG